MKKPRWNETISVRMMWLLIGICVVTLLMMHFAYDECWELEDLFRSIPAGETLQNFDVRMFRIVCVTDRAEYVSTNYNMISMAVLFCVSAVALAVTAAIDMHVREKRRKEAEKPEDGPPDGD